MDSLKILSEGLRPGPLKEAAAKVKLSIEGGRRLSDSMGSNPLVFDKLDSGHDPGRRGSGYLRYNLEFMVILYGKKSEIKGQIKGAMIYPAVIVLVAIAVVTGILVFIIRILGVLHLGRERASSTNDVRGWH